MGISKFKHIYEAELQLSTRFPFHCQDRLPGLSKRGSEKEVETPRRKRVRGLGEGGKAIGPGFEWSDFF